MDSGHSPRVESSGPAQVFWEKTARTTAWRINFGWWLDRFAPLAFALGAMGAGALLLLRRMRDDASLFWPLWNGMAALAVLAAWWLARRHFESAASARVRIESAMRLHTRLSAAAAGVGAWPEPRTPVRTGLHWQWPRTLALFLTGAALLGAAAWLPIPPREPAPTHRIETPASLAEVQQWIEQLRTEKLVEPAALNALQKEAESLLQQPAEEWYQHHGLEAADHLQEQTAQSLHDLQNDLAAVERAVNTWQQAKGELPASALKTWQDELNDALKNLQLGNLPLDASRLAQLKNLDPAKLQQLSPAQLAALKKALQDGQGGLQKISPNAKAPQFAAGKDPSGQPGSGGPGGGGPPAPLTMAKDAPPIGSARPEALEAGDLARATLGDLQGLSKGEHEVDRSLYHGPTAGGGASTGAGGDPVWQNSLTPEERAILKNYYQ